MCRLSKGFGVLVSAIFVVSLSQPSYAEDDFAKWKQQTQDSFQEYKDKRDKEFTAFLKMHWKEIDLLKGIERDPEPKPVVMPVAKPMSEKPTPVIKDVPIIKIPKVTKPVEIRPIPEPVVKAVVPPEKKIVRKGRKLVLSYLGGRHTVYYDQKLKTSINRRIDKKVISDFWSALSLADYDDLIEQINEKSRVLQLNDWAYALLVHDISRKIYPSSEAGQSLFTWFVLAKVGYQSRIAYNNHKVFLLVPSEQRLYAVPYFTFAKVRYYAVRFDGKGQKLGQVYTYDGNYPGANKALNMRLNNIALLDAQSARRDLSFDFEGKHYEIRAAYDNERIRFMNTYPQLDLEWYFKGKVSAAASTPLQQQLSNHMKGMDEQKAINFLLRFVQTSLRYKTDEVQFGKENYLFPEETLYYPYSDCEDRSILFAWLVHSLLGMEVVGLDYPGHVATAVLLKGNVTGDSVMHDGKRYVVADPTYINALVGMAMPNFKKKKPEVITIH